MRRVVITGANKGIGLASVEAILSAAEDTFVFLGSRDSGRGAAARDAICEKRQDWRERVAVLPIDVTDPETVASAVQQVLSGCGEDEHPLYGVINNAGIGLPDADLSQVLAVNTIGLKRVCDAFVPLLHPQGGRVVNVTSAAGPTYVAGCSPERQQMLTRSDVTWPEIAAFIEECLSLQGDADAFTARGLGGGSAYGISKACANAYTICLARQHSGLRINACTPGFIETDLTRAMAASRGMSPADLGMKTPREGTVSILYLLLGELEGSGHYFGSDALRSPMDRYRSPGDPPYRGT